MNLKMIRSNLIKSFYTVKDVFIFLLISLVVIEGWRQLNLDQLFSPIFSSLFNWLMYLEFAISSFILKLIMPVTITKAELLITFPNNQSIFLFEGCSGLKQVMQFTIIMLLYPGAWRKKAWFIPFAALVLVFAAIIHFIFLCFILYKTPENYQFMHDHISRWFFFLIFFLLWVFFTRKSPISGNNG